MLSLIPAKRTKEDPGGLFREFPKRGRPNGVALILSDLQKRQIGQNRREIEQIGALFSRVCKTPANIGQNRRKSDKMGHFSPVPIPLSLFWGTPTFENVSDNMTAAVPDELTARRCHGQAKISAQATRWRKEEGSCEQGKHVSLGDNLRSLKPPRGVPNAPGKQQGTSTEGQQFWQFGPFFRLFSLPFLRKILVSVKFVSAILGPEMRASALWGAWKNALFLQEKPLSVIFLLLGLGGGGGASADFIFMGARIFLKFGPFFRLFSLPFARGLFGPLFGCFRLSSRSGVRNLSGWPDRS